MGFVQTWELVHLLFSVAVQGIDQLCSRSARFACAFGISQKLLTKLKQRLPSSEFCIKVQVTKWTNGHFSWGVLISEQEQQNEALS